MGTFDANGDLIVLECHWNKQSVKDQLTSKPHKVVRLSDTNSDRVFDKRTVIAEGLGFPEGIMCSNEIFSFPLHRRSSSSRIRSRRFFENREVWYDGGTLTHCANDLHGPLLGPMVGSTGPRSFCRTKAQFDRKARQEERNIHRVKSFSYLSKTSERWSS